MVHHEPTLSCLCLTRDSGELSCLLGDDDVSNANDQLALVKVSNQDAGRILGPEMVSSRKEADELF